MSDFALRVIDVAATKVIARYDTDSYVDFNQHYAKSLEHFKSSVKFGVHSELRLEAIIFSTEINVSLYLNLAGELMHRES
jgi:hypothetical protein